MIRNVRSALLVLCCFSALALVGCGSSFSCDSASACSADPAPSADDIAACKAELDGACGSEYQAAAQCIQDHQTCTADDTTDPSSGSECTSELTALVTCEGNQT